jgi:hypothetical protein
MGFPGRRKEVLMFLEVVGYWELEGRDENWGQGGWQEPEQELRLCVIGYQSQRPSLTPYSRFRNSPRSPH